MLETPPCGLSAGKQHNDSPPPAVVDVFMEWETRDGGFRRATRSLCLTCYMDKAEETMELAGNRYSRLQITHRHSKAGQVRSLPLAVGSPARLADDTAWSEWTALRGIGGTPTPEENES